MLLKNFFKIFDLALHCFRLPIRYFHVINPETKVDLMSLQRTPLYDSHIALQARMVPFGGWEMPVQYKSIIAEYESTRQNVAMFDICHMGEFLITGDPVACGLDRIVTQRLVDLPVRACRYGMMLNETGGVIDDLIVFHLADEQWMAIVNAATKDKDAAHIQRHLSDSAVFQDISGQTGKIDVQGPQARNVLKSLIPGIETLDYYTFDVFDVMGENVVVSRTGYTGELGYEIYYPWDRTHLLWETLLDRGVEPAGLGARDLLRVEMGYPLYGHEISETIFPLDAGLNRFVDWEKDFVGKTPLLQYKENKPARKLVCFVAKSRRSPRSGQKIFLNNKTEIGVVTSGAFSPALKQGVGLGFVPCDREIGEEIFFGDESALVPSNVVNRPIYKNGSLKT